MISLYPHQREAVKKLKNGSILCGGVGSGKSRTALAYYFLHEGGKIGEQGGCAPMKERPRDLYIITTARKRDTGEWREEMIPFLLSPDPKISRYQNQVVIDSWNNIGKYADVTGAFFIFDEQRVVGNGAWVRAFLKIARGGNDWILLSATPGDCWMDYIPVFIANGFYKNRTAFHNEHVIFSRHTTYPKVERYIGTGKLIRERAEVLVQMPSPLPAELHRIDIPVSYDKPAYLRLKQTRADPETGEPIGNISALCYALRKIVNEDPSRIREVCRIVKAKGRVIVFYNFDYERELLLGAEYEPGTTIAEWTGHKHEPIPETEKWVYLVQYTAGAEGWNCIRTDTIIFYSQNYSYKTMLQAAGRTNRLNTPYGDLYYFHLISTAEIDRGIGETLRRKKKFNETEFIQKTIANASR